MERFFYYFLPSINQLMINTLNTYCIKTQQKVLDAGMRAPKQFTNYFSIILVVLCINIPSLQAKETILIGSLNSKNDKIFMRLLEQTNSFIEYDRYIQSKQFKCKAILKNDLTSNYLENITKVDMDLDYGRVLMINSKQQIQGYSSEQLKDIKRLDKILDLLTGKCLYYQTITFIYQYCHKEHVRQFDSHYTKAYNIKAEFQDISMGTYNPDFYAARKVRKGIKQLTPEEKKVTLPQRSDFSVEYNFLTVEDIDNIHGQMQIEESEDGKLIFTSINILASDQYYTHSPIFIQMICQSSNIEIRNFAMVVHPYSLVYTKKAAKCERYISHRVLPDRIQYFKDSSNQIIRAYGNYLYGNVEQVCAKNLAWQKQAGNSQYDNTFTEGSLLFIQLFNERTQTLQNHYVNIKKIYDAQLIEVEVALGKSFKRLITSDSYINSSTVNSKRLVGNITKCQVLFKKKLNLSNKIQLNYTGKGLVQLTTQSQVKVGQSFGCIFRGESSHVKIVDFEITIAKHLWLNYYQTYITTNTFIYQSKFYQTKEYILQEAQNRHCFTFAQPQHQHSQSPSSNPNKFTSIVKLTTNSQSFRFNSSNMHNIFIITIKNGGVIKLITRATDGTIYMYLISQGQMIKMVQFANGTKQIIKQNKYYQNSTNPSSEIHKNFIYLKISKLPNGTYYGGLWKYKDYIYFPRFVLFDEELVQLQRVNAYAYIRILNIDKMRHSQSLSIVKYMKKLQQHYMMKERKYESHLFLDKSYTIGYNYVSGEYCGQPVNKFRKTTVYLACGKPWFQITKLLQTTPCEYSIRIQTTLLCRQGYKQVVESDSNILKKGESDVVINSGVVCHPSGNLYSQASVYLYVKKSKQLPLLQ